MRCAVVGGGIVGLFAAYYLLREGADVTLFEPGDLGAGSVHAAGILEPSRAYRTNTFSFLRRVVRYLRTGTSTIRSFDGSWLVESVRWLERTPVQGADAAILRMADESMAAYHGLADTANDFGFATRGLTERYDDPGHFVEERELALSRSSATPVEVREEADGTGSLFFPGVAWLHTERFVDRMARELAKAAVVRERVGAVGLDGSVTTRRSTTSFDAAVVATGVSSRTLGLPLTGVRGYGWHIRSRARLETAKIVVDKGIALVPFGSDLKVTGGWDFDLSTGRGHAARDLRAVRTVVPVDEVTDFKDGSRPCTPDGLPTVGRNSQLVVANGGFRLGWSFAPALGQHAARLALGQADNDPFLARFCRDLHGGPLG